MRIADSWNLILEVEYKMLGRALDLSVQSFIIKKITNNIFYSTQTTSTLDNYALSLDIIKIFAKYW